MYSYKTGVTGRLIAGNAIIHPLAKIGEGVEIGFGVVVHGDVDIRAGATIYDNSVIGRPSHRPVGLAHFDQTWAIIDEGSVVGSGVTIYRGVHVGKRVLIGDGARIRENCTIADDCIVGSNCTFQRDVVMGRGSRVIDLSHITNGVVIGEGAFVSTGVLTMDDDSFNGLNDADRELHPPLIAPFASVGGGAVLLPGVEVGMRAVVASGAVVTKSVDPGALVMGVPARRKHDLGYDGQPGAPSHGLLHTAPAFDYKNEG